MRREMAMSRLRRKPVSNATVKRKQPAIFSGRGATASGALAVILFRSLSIVGIHDVLTAKIFHDPRYQCIFKNINAPQINTAQDGKLIEL
jgi:hypothetical protein